jgi:aspartate 1-decarboxylase
MFLTMMKAKIHRAKVTQCDLNYEGSVTVDPLLLEQAGILPHEQVDILNINNGARFTTYAITGEAGSGIIGINGAAARLCQKDDLVILCSYAQMTPEEAQSFKPKVLVMNPDNTVKEVC